MSRFLEPKTVKRLDTCRAPFAGRAIRFSAVLLTALAAILVSLAASPTSAVTCEDVLNGLTDLKGDIKGYTDARTAIITALRDAILEMNPVGPLTPAHSNALDPMIRKLWGQIVFRQSLRARIGLSTTMEPRFVRENSEGAIHFAPQYDGSDLSFTLRPIHLVEKYNPRDYEYYSVREARPARNFADLMEALDDIIDGLKVANRNFAAIALGFPSVTKPSSSTERSPKNTFYKGFQAMSLEEVLKLALADLTPLHYAPEKLEAEKTAFLNAPLKERQSKFGDEVFARKRDRRTWLIGGSRHFIRARGWGPFILEYEVPHDSVYEQRGDEGGLFTLEQESFVPFRLPGAWLKRVLDKDQKVLWERQPQ